ncbi:MAG TPA: DUF2383 domain-containing protein, partial [Myxococcota bacterium]
MTLTLDEVMLEIEIDVRGGTGDACEHEPVSADVVAAVKMLVELDIDATVAYAQAAEGVDELDLAVRDQLFSFRADHERHVDALSAVLESLGEDTPERERNLSGFAIEGMVPVRAALGTENALKAMRRNEVTMSRKIAWVLALDDLPEDIRALVELSRT